MPTDKKEEKKAVEDVLEWLKSKGTSWVTTRRPSNAGKIPEVPFDELKEHDLHLICRYEQKNEFPPSNVIFLEPPEKDVKGHAALWMKWNLEAPNREYSYYVGIWSVQDAFPKGEAAAKHLSFIGYRFEAPQLDKPTDVDDKNEKKEEETAERHQNHAYHHMQPNRTMGPRDALVTNALPGSERSPTVPLPGGNPVDLVLCVVLALYGFDGFYEMIDELPNNANRTLQAAIQRMTKLGHPYLAA